MAAKLVCPIAIQAEVLDAFARDAVASLTHLCIFAMYNAMQLTDTRQACAHGTPATILGVNSSASPTPRLGHRDSPQS